MLELLFSIIILFLSCLGLTSICYIIKKILLKNNKNLNKIYTILVIDENTENSEITIRNTIEKINYSEISGNSFIVYNSSGNTEEAKISARLAGIYGLNYIESAQELDYIISNKSNLL